MKYGETRSAPRSTSVVCCAAIPLTPPIARSEQDAHTGGVVGAVQRRVGRGLHGGRDSEEHVAVEPARVLRAENRRLVEARTSAATRTGNPDASKARMKPIPLCPATAASHVERWSFPSGVTAPSPVTATRRIGGEPTRG